MSLGALAFLVLLVGKLGFEFDVSWFQVFLPLIIELVLDVVMLGLFFLFGKKFFEKRLERW